MLRPFLAALVLFPLAAGAQDCPTAADLDTGIRFTLTDGETEEFRRHEDGRIGAVFYRYGEPVTLVMLHRGLYLSEVTDIEDFTLLTDGRTTYTHLLAADDLPPPLPGAQFDSDVTVTGPDGTLRETHSHEFGQVTRLRLGDCGYRMMPVTVRYLPDPQGETDLLHWLPDLGVSLLVESRGDGGVDAYRYVGIERMMDRGFP